MSKYEPKFGRVLIEREVKKQTAGGILLPDSAIKRNAACVGKIVALGETAGFTESYYQGDSGEWNSKITQTMKVGDKVIFGRHSGAWVDATYSEKGHDNDDGSLFICQDQDILAVIKE